MQLSEPLISVIIPHYNDVDNLARCLDLLERQTVDRNFFELIVADNNSTVGVDRIRDLVGNRAQLVICKTPGAGPARNAGAGVSRARKLAFVDSDCRPSPKWLESGIKSLENSAVVGGQVDVDVYDPARLSPAEAFEVVFAFDNESYIKQKGFSGSGNLFVRRDVWDRVGGFSGQVSEDVEWSDRARAAGYAIVFSKDARVAHPARRTIAELERKWSRVTLESYLLWQKQKKSKLAWLLRSLLYPASAIAHTPKVLMSPKLSSAGDRIGALWVLYWQRHFRLFESVRLAFSSEKK